MRDQLSERVFLLISQGVRAFGTYDPDEIMPMIEEELTVDEHDRVAAYLKWVHAADDGDEGNARGFGHSTYRVRYAEFLDQLPDFMKDGRPRAQQKLLIVNNTDYEMSHVLWRIRRVLQYSREHDNHPIPNVVESHGDTELLYDGLEEHATFTLNMKAKKGSPKEDELPKSES